MQSKEKKYVLGVGGSKESFFSIWLKWQFWEIIQYWIAMYNVEKIYMFQNVSMGHLSEKGSNIPLKSLSTKETYMLHMKCTFKSHQKNFRAPLHWWIVSGIPDVCENLDPVCNFQFVNWKINRKLPPPQIGRISGWHVLTGFVTHVT